MNYSEALSYCLSLPETSKHLESGKRHRIVLSVDGECYGLFETGAPIQWQFTVQIDPDQLESLLNPPQVRAADMAGGGCWITIERLENFDGARLQQLIDCSYQRSREGAIG